MPYQQILLTWVSHRVLMAKIRRSINKITSKGFVAFLDSLLCVFAFQKKFTKNFAGENIEKANLQKSRHDRM